MPSLRTISLALLQLAALCAGCNSHPAILEGGHYHPAGATILPRDAPEYTLSAPCYIIPEETLHALLSE